MQASPRQRKETYGVCFSQQEPARPLPALCYSYSAKSPRLVFLGNDNQPDTDNRGERLKGQIVGDKKASIGAKYVLSLRALKSPSWAQVWLCPKLE
ncbi:hypothetical protein MDA_GLEAN10015909 [Myotis davidii]|uniref:Uncharacterized protein n=1 Tax=Myotis davidii TaxID=225400 RepID=L5MFP4_MYODS|nr:hypothetical protein MDA_GLEAN10015909 [Myotis davidii]